MLRAMLILAAAAAACLLAQTALMSRRARQQTGELNDDVNRWEDEGGNSALLASGMDDTFAP